MEQSSTGERRLSLLIADDNPDDRLFRDEGILTPNNVRLRIGCVANGRCVLDYMRGEGEYWHADAKKRSLPDLVMLDLDMPELDGMHTLCEMKKDQDLRDIPVIIMATCSTQNDIISAYDQGAAGYVDKPVSFPELEEKLKVLADCWADILLMNPGAGVIQEAIAHQSSGV